MRTRRVVFVVLIALGLVTAASAAPPKDANLEQPDMAEMSWNPSIGDPDHMMYMLLSSDRFPPAFNAGYYQNDRVDDLLRRGRTTIDEKAHVPLYREAQKLVVEDAPWIFVDHGKQVIAHRKRVQGFKLHPNFDLVLTPVWLQ